ncbi:MAG: ryR domain protein [Parcubacteria group bacterium]|nr:ryR domain protein [Parcubacteria group bacterium]
MPTDQSLTLNDRRAEFVYEGARLAAIAAQAPVVPVSWVEREEPFRAQFLRVIERQCSSQRCNSPEELHENWVQEYMKMGWVYGPIYSRERRTHPDMVPYASLEQLERDKDAVFMALCEIARQFIYEEG